MNSFYGCPRNTIIIINFFTVDKHIESSYKLINANSYKLNEANSYKLINANSYKLIEANSYKLINVNSYKLNERQYYMYFVIGRFKSVFLITTHWVTNVIASLSMLNCQISLFLTIFGHVLRTSTPLTKITSSHRNMNGLNSKLQMVLAI